MTGSRLRKRRWALTAIKVAVTVGLLSIIWYQVRNSTDEIYETLQKLSFPLLMIAFANHLSGRFLMGWQTSAGLRGHGLSYRPLRLFIINLKTLFFGFFLPGDLSGSAVKWYLIARIDGKHAEVLATILYIRLVNLIVVLITGLGAIVFTWPFNNQALMVWGLGALALLLGVTLSIHLRLSVVIWDGLRTRFPALFRGKLGAGLSKLHDALLAFSQYSWKDIAILWGFSVAIKLSITVSFWLVAQSMGIEIGFASLLWMHSVVELVQFVPITFSGIGTREITLIYMFQLVGVPEAVGLSFALVLFALRIAMVLAGGICAGLGTAGLVDVPERPTGQPRFP